MRLERLAVIVDTVLRMYNVGMEVVVRWRDI